MTSLGGARPPALNIREGGQENASANLANTSGGARPHRPAPAAKAVPPAPPPPRRRQDPESSSYSDETEEEGQGVRLRSRTPPDRRVPAEPSAPPKARGTAVKSKAKIVVPQEVEGRSESSSSSPEPQASGAIPEAQQGQGDDPPPG